MAAGSPTSIPAAQAWAVSRQNPSRSGGDAPGQGGLEDAGQLGDIGAQPEAAPGRVLEDDHRRVRTVVDLGEGQGEPVGQPAGARPPRRRRGASRRAR